MVIKPGFGSLRSSYMVCKIMSYAFAGKIVPGHLYQATQHSNQQPNELKRYRITTNGATFRTGITHRPGASKHHSDSSNPTASSGVDQYQTETCKTPVFWRLARLEKRLDLGCATRNTTPQAPCTELHGRYRTPKQLARNAKNPGKTRVLQRRGQDSNLR